MKPEIICNCNRYNTVDIEDLRNAMKQLEDYRIGILSNVDQTVDQVEKMKAV